MEENEVKQRLKGKKVVYLTAGAAGMYCGSCMRDNALVSSLIRRGLDVELVPLYTPIRTDDADMSVDRVFFGGINVFLQQRIPLFRHLPAFLDRWLDHPSVIRRLTVKAVKVDPKELGELTLSMVRGESGFQRKEVRNLVKWLKEESRPDLVCLTNLLVGGSAPALKRELNVPILVTLQGDDLFIEDLAEPYRTEVLGEMKRLAAGIDGFITFNQFYAQKMGDLLDIPPEKFHFTSLGIDTAAFDEVWKIHQVREAPDKTLIGYFARVCPEKGFDVLVDAFIQLKKKPEGAGIRLKAGGWLPAKDRDFYEAQLDKLRAAGLEDDFEYVGSPDFSGKLAFFKEVDIFTVPANFSEPKGIYALEAMASGIPIVKPDHSGFPELVERSGGGLLFPKGDAEALAQQWMRLAGDFALRRDLGENGRDYVVTHRHKDAMAETTEEVFAKFLS